MSDEVSNAAPVGGIGGFPGRSPRDVPQRQERGRSQPEPHEPPADKVRVHHASEVARRLLRERVLARTRVHLELEDGEFVPRFAEAVDQEPVGAFLGRLIGAQNQLAALRANAWRPEEVRHALDVALREAVVEVLELLAADHEDHSGTGATFVTDVLAEYARRLAALAGHDG